MTDASNTRKSRPSAAGVSKLRDWSPSSDGSMVSRTFALENAEIAAKTAKRAFSVVSKSGKPFEIGVNGLSLTVRLPATGGAVEDTVRKLARRLTPKDEADSAARKAKRAAKKSGEAAAATDKAVGQAKSDKPAKADKPTNAARAARKAAKTPV